MKLRNRFERFCFRHRNKGIPNLILYIVIGSGLVSLAGLFRFDQIYELLYFDRGLILKGQVWRLFTYVFAANYVSGPFDILSAALYLYCTYSLGRAVERSIGSLKFTLYYFSGIILMDLFAMIFGGFSLFWSINESKFIVRAAMPLETILYSLLMISFLNMSLIIYYATQYPDNTFLLFFLIPIKAKVLSIIYLGYTFIMVAYFSVAGALFHNLFPLVALLNFFLFAGSDIKNLLPLSWQVAFRRKKRKAAAKKEPIQFRQGNYATPKKKEALPYHHRCTICGRTDTTNPELEFRYCSRCNGYHCYCSEHISNHTHVQ